MAGLGCLATSRRRATAEDVVMAAVAPEVSAIGIRDAAVALWQRHNARGTRCAVHTGVVDGGKAACTPLTAAPPLK